MPPSGYVFLLLSLLPIAWPFVVSYSILTPESSDQSGANQQFATLRPSRIVLLSSFAAFRARFRISSLLLSFRSVLRDRRLPGGDPALPGVCALSRVAR